MDAPLPALNGDGRHSAARLLARLHGWPVGEALVPLEWRPMPAAELAARLWPLVADRVAGHCAGDGIPAPGQLTAGGLAAPAGCVSLTAPADAPPVTVVIATRDRTDSLLRCLASVSRLDYPAFDVIIVDSAPLGDTTAKTLETREWPFPLRYLRVPRPGLALAHNAALAEATGQIVAITDDDVEVDRSWLAALARAFGESDATCVTGLILPAELETRAQLLVEQAGGFARGFDTRVFRLGTPGQGPLFPFTAGRLGSGANMAFRTGWLVSHGGFDPATGAGSPARGGDDLIAFLAVITGGGTLTYEPAAIVRHWHRRDYEGLRRQAFGYGAGFGSYVTASVCARPALLGAMLRRTVPALRHLLDPSSVKNEGRAPGFPRELVWRERAGMLAGPFAYGLSRWRYRDCAGPGVAPAPTASRLPRLVRSGRKGIPDAAVRAALARGGWRSERTLRTVSDTAVIMVSAPGGRTGTLKLAATAAGAASLSREHEVLVWLGSRERLGTWRELLPVPLDWAESARGAYLLTSRLPGRDARRLPPAAVAGLTAAAMAAIAPLHGHAATTAELDEVLLRRWVDEPAARLSAVAGPAGAVEEVTAAVRGGLAGRRMTLGWTHGDFHPGNVLAGSRGQIVGIVDWDQARERDLVAADVAFWLLTMPGPGQKREFGARVATRLGAGRCWTPGESRLLDIAADDLALGQALLLLAWLRHVAGNLTKSGRYARSPVWLRLNVRPVLRQVRNG